jgi:hypothetical protein
MSPKEKAFSLFAEYASRLNDGRIAKRCTIVAVDLIIQETLLHDETTYQHGRTSFWKEVKQEIEKL